MTLRNARKSAGLTIDQLAKAVGVTSAAICRYENGNRTPRKAIAKRIGTLLNVPWYELKRIIRFYRFSNRTK